MSFPPGIGTALRGSFCPLSHFLLFSFPPLSSLGLGVMGHLFQESQLKACEHDPHLMSLTVWTPLLRKPVAVCVMQREHSSPGGGMWWLHFGRALSPVSGWRRDGLRLLELRRAQSGGRMASPPPSLAFPQGGGDGTEPRPDPTWNISPSHSPLRSVRRCTSAPRDRAAPSAGDRFSLGRV